MMAQQVKQSEETIGTLGKSTQFVNWPSLGFLFVKDTESVHNIVFERSLCRYNDACYIFC